MKNRLICTQCRRFGCPLSMLKKSLSGAYLLKADLGQICADCLTPEEDMRICKETMDYALGRASRVTPAIQRKH